MNTKEIVRIDFTRPEALKKPVRWNHLGNGDYVDSRTGHHYENVRLNGRYTWRKLKSVTHAAAIKEIRKKRSDLELSKLGLAANPYQATRNAILTVAAMLENYALAGFPKKRNVTSPRSKTEIAQQKKQIEHLTEFFGPKNPKELSSEDLLNYHAWRLRKIEKARLDRAGGDPEKVTDRRPGHRAVDVERITLSNAYDLAIDRAKQTGIIVNPFARKIKRFRHSSQVEHCRDFQPENAEELNRLAGELFESWRSEALGWQLLFEAMIGQRSHEIIKLRMDARSSREAGFVHKNCLFTYKSNTHKGTYPYAEIHPDLRECLAAHKAWHAYRFPNGNPWYFPSPKKRGKPVCSTSLTRALVDLTAELALPRRKSHGLRSYYVNVLRSGGDRGRKYSDGEIALRIGQRTQGKMIVDVYGEILPYPLTWRPETGSPAWSRWLPKPAIAAEQLTLRF